MKTILLLDDDQSVRQSFVDYFEDNEWHPVEAGSGEDALDLLEHEQPVAAIVDIRLPGMDGNMFIRKALALDVQMVFVICTGSPEYLVPPDLLEISNVSKRMFKKPVTDLEELQKEILLLIDQAHINVDQNNE